MPNAKSAKSCRDTKDAEQMLFALLRIRSEKVRYFLAMLAGAIAEDQGAKRDK